MCGLSAIFSYGAKAPLVDHLELGNISNHMSARGPEGEGQWFSTDGKVGFAYKRLAIIDMSEQGAQPMALLDNGGLERLIIRFFSCLM